VPDVSNPTRRVLDVLSFLAAHSTETFTLAEIARHLRLSNGSAHRVLTTMTSARFLSRNEKHRTYTLGMALVAIGQAAIETHRGIDIARRELARLAAELNVQCSASVAIGEDLLVLVKEGTPQSHQGLTRVGERRPLVPPWGMCHVAWSGEPAIHSYVARVSGHLSAASRAHLLRAFPVIRQRGFAIAANGPIARQARQATVLPVDQNRDAEYWSTVHGFVNQLTPRELQLFRITEAGADGVSYLAAPVFSPAGSVAMQFVISGIPRDLGVKKLERCAERLCTAAALVTSETHGHKPEDQALR
jgi:DNA-binding IclR family transcriptional regulator